MVQKIISGGQSGIDRAALDVALQLGIACGGWCPKGRKAEDGPISSAYPLQETPSLDYAQRTEWNVRDSDGTLILTRGTPTEGTAWTARVASRLRKSCLIVDFLDQPSGTTVTSWLDLYQIRILNIAGPRESKCPGIYAEASAFMRKILSGESASQSNDRGRVSLSP